MNPQTITLENTEIRILSTVKGLVSESKIVENEIDSFNPDIVVLGMGPEEVNGTREWDGEPYDCLLYTSPSPRDQRGSRMPASA